MIDVALPVFLLPSLSWWSINAILGSNGSKWGVFANHITVGKGEWFATLVHIATLGQATVMDS